MVRPAGMIPASWESPPLGGAPKACHQRESGRTWLFHARGRRSVRTGKGGHDRSTGHSKGAIAGGGNTSGASCRRGGVKRVPAALRALLYPNAVPPPITAKAFLKRQTRTTRLCRRRTETRRLSSCERQPLDFARGPDPFDSAQGHPEPAERMSLSNGRADGRRRTHSLALVATSKPRFLPIPGENPFLRRGLRGFSSVSSVFS
jgi:hypothetical protein